MLQFVATDSRRKQRRHFRQQQSAESSWTGWFQCNLFNFVSEFAQNDPSKGI